MKCCTLIIYICFVTLISGIFPPRVLAQPETPDRKIVRVGYFSFANFNNVDDMGNCSGYGYDYLQEISKYTNWEYQYVFASWTDCLTMLERGEIDLLGSVQKTPERLNLFNFATFDSGISYAVLAVHQDFDNAMYENFNQLNALTVGLLSGSSRNQQFAEFCRKNGVQPATKTYATEAELDKALLSHEIDAICTSNLRKNPYERIIARFAPSPFYFVTAKGNTRLLSELNYALEKIKMDQPFFEANLYEKYYSNDRSTHPVFTAEEMNFIKNYTVQPTVFAPRNEPLSYFKNDGVPAGVIYDVLKIIEKESGLQFQIIPTNSYLESLHLFETKQAQILCLRDYNADWLERKSYLATNPYLKIPCYSVQNNHIDDPEKILALTRDYLNDIAMLSDLSGRNVKYYDTIEDCLDAVEQGEAGETYLSRVMVEHFLGKTAYSNLAIKSRSNVFHRLTFAVNSDNPLLRSILNKTLAAISEDEFQEITLRHITAISHDIKKEQDESLFFKRLCLLLTALSAVCALSAYRAHKNRSKNELNDQ